MRNLLLLLFCVVFYRQTAAQCSMIPVPLSQRAAASVAVVEGKVISKISSWDSQGTMIYTTHTIEIYKVFKGNITNPTIELLTEGGIVGNQKISVSPSLELNVGDVGLFTCTNLSRIHPVLARSATPKFEAYASAQGFVRYDLATASAAEPFTSYNNIEYDLYPVLTGAFGRYREIKEFDSNANARLNPIVNTASITGFSPSTVTAGTETTITITGSGFGSSQGSGTVGFKNADDGGATYITPLASQYVSWTSTQIVVEVPDNAGTGTIQVTQGTTSTSASSLTVSYAHLNVEFDPGTGDEAYQTDHVNDNGSGGYTWRMNTAFAANTAANASFMRAFDTWRCGTGVDWTIGTTTSIDDAVSDGTNIICFDDAAPLSAGILGVCYSYWSGCASGPTIVWYVNELDIIFDDGSNISPLTWEFGTALPSGSEYDFETVAVHELGHGHQLGHVIAPGAIMHYAISNGAANRALGTDDLAGGNFVQAKSVVANVCGPGATSNYSCGNPPVAAFSGTPTTVCTGSTVTFTDLSTNSPTSWSWTFTGGTPSTSTLQNPIITYNTPGTHNVSLTATNGNGSDGQTTNNYITVNASPTNTGTVTSVTCNGGNNGAINITPSGGNSPYTFSWNPSGQTTEDRTSLTAGTYTVTVTDDDGCTVQSSYTVTQPAAISVSMSKTNASCANNDGTATATPSGGVSPYSYLWAPGGETTQQITGLAGGSYTCTVTDDNTCSSSGNITVSTTACGPTLTPASCGMTATSLSNNIYTVAVANATNYRYKFVNAAQGFNQIFVKGNSSTYFVLTAAAGIQYGRIYDVTVSAYVSGAWTSFGAVCTVTTPAFPTTKLITSDCGITVGTITETVFCDIVPGRQKYQWKLVDQVSSTTYTYIRNGPAENFCMSWISGIQYGKTYDVQVRAMVGGVWGSYGPVCTLTSPAVPTPQLTAAYCGATLANASGQIFCTAVSGATNYIWKIENSSLGYSETRVRGNYNTNYWLSWNTGLQVNTTYTVTIRAYVNGAWGVYGNPCTITTGPTMLAPEEQSGPVPSELRLVNEEPIGTLEVYPNPCVEKIAIISAERIRTVVMYNALGERVHSILVNNTSAEINMTQLPAGLYFIYAETAEGTLIRKVLKE